VCVCVCAPITIAQRSEHRVGCVQDGGLRGLAVLHLHSAAMQEGVRGSLHHLRPRGTSRLFLSHPSSWPSLSRRPSSSSSSPLLAEIRAWLGFSTGRLRCWHSTQLGPRGISSPAETCRDIVCERTPRHPLISRQRTDPQDGVATWIHSHGSRSEVRCVNHRMDECGRWPTARGAVKRRPACLTTPALKGRAARTRRLFPKLT